MNALLIDGEQATRVGRLLLDTDERDVLHIGVSNGVVYYATDARPRPVTPGAHGCESIDWTQLPFVEQRPPAPRELTIERVALRDGRFERLPSFDVVSAFEDTGPLWHQFVARGERVLWASDRRLFAVDFAGGEPRVEVHDVGLWGCASLDLRDNRAYCGQQLAGYVEIALDEP